MVAITVVECGWFVMIKHKFHCNNCYSEECKNKSEGCFTGDTKKFIRDNTSPCLDGTWRESSYPVFKEIK